MAPVRGSEFGSRHTLYEQNCGGSAELVRLNVLQFAQDRGGLDEMKALVIPVWPTTTSTAGPEDRGRQAHNPTKGANGGPRLLMASPRIASMATRPTPIRHCERASIRTQVSAPAYESVRLAREPGPTAPAAWEIERSRFKRDRRGGRRTSRPRLNLGRTWAAPGPHPTRNDAKPRETMQGVEAVEIPSPVGRIGRKPYAARGGANQAEPGRIGLGNRCSIP